MVAGQMFAATAKPLQYGQSQTGTGVQAARGDLFGPRGACLFGENGPLWVADTGHHRLLRWPDLNEEPAAPTVVGQSGAAGEAPNRGGDTGPLTLRMPAAICALGDGMAVADSWNHRILIWHSLPNSADCPPDLVLGQRNPCAGDANRGQPTCSADSLFWPSGVHWDGQALYVADAGNRRVLIWHSRPEHNGQAADLILGQTSAACRDQAAGRDLDAIGMVWPHAITRWHDRLVVADAGANRIMLWDAPVARSGQPCDAVLGQADAHARVYNQGHARPGPATLAMPYAVAATGDWLIVADTANSRLLGWHSSAASTGSAAQRVHGQPDFACGGDNRWGNVSPNSLCWPYGLSSCGDRLLVADTGNSRIQCWSVTAASG